MKTLALLTVLAILSAVASVYAYTSDTFTPEAKRTDAIRYFKLTSNQIDIMDAYYEGITQRKSENKFSRRSIRIAGCYAAENNIPDKYDVPHRAYIRDFETVEKNYYPWFAGQGVGENEAYEIGQLVKKTADRCHLIIRR